MAEAAFGHAQRLGQPVVALMIDIDNFKQIAGVPGERAPRGHRRTPAL
jgi:GGDEF domain-containing protein